MEEPDPQVSQVAAYQELDQAWYDLSSRGMHQAARWVAEQLNSFDPELLQPATQAAQEGALKPLRTDNTDRTPQYMLARQHFDFKEYQRAAHVLQGLTGPKALFFRCWCLYLAGEKRKEAERAEQPSSQGSPTGSGTDGSGPGQTRGQGAAGGGRLPGNGVIVLGAAGGLSSGPRNPELNGIEEELVSALTRGEGDAFCAYLLGVVLLDKGYKREALPYLIQAVNAYPANWAAWQALQRLAVVTEKEFPYHELPKQHWARLFFDASVALEVQKNAEALSHLQHLSQVFPRSLTLASMVAQAHYNVQNYDHAQALYEDISLQDPCRLEGMDVYSNILFVKEDSSALSALASRVMSVDKYRPESCCVVGNYYSDKNQHETAVMWFKRALRLDRSFLAAWTLMGHEYIELKNTAAAIEAYRAAVEISPHDYRAWYGLGQAHELLKLPYYALYYFRRAAALRPQDARMWVAMGQCYASSQVGNQDMAVRCFQRAVEQHDPEGIALHLLAKLRESRGESDEAELLFRANLARLDAQAAEAGAGLAGGAALSTDAVEALVFLAGRCKETGRYADALGYCERLLDVGGPARDFAKSLAHDVRSCQERQRAADAAADAAHAAAAAHTGAAGTSYAPQTASRTPLGAAAGAAAMAAATGPINARNLFSALGNVGTRFADSTQRDTHTGHAQPHHAGACASRAGNYQTHPVTPLPGPMFGFTPLPGQPYTAGTPMSVAMSEADSLAAGIPGTPAGGAAGAGPSGGGVFSVSGGVGGLGGGGFMEGEEGGGFAAQWQHMAQHMTPMGHWHSRATPPAAQVAGTPYAAAATPAEMDMATPMSAREQCVIAVAQQLGVDLHEASTLLDKAGGDASKAVMDAMRARVPSPAQALR